MEINREVGRVIFYLIMRSHYPYLHGCMQDKSRTSAECLQHPAPHFGAEQPRQHQFNGTKRLDTNTTSKSNSNNYLPKISDQISLFSHFVKYKKLLKKEEVHNNLGILQS